MFIKMKKKNSFFFNRPLETKNLFVLLETSKNYNKLILTY